MTAKEYLNEIHKYRSRMLSLKRREEELRTAAEGLRAIVYDKDKVQTSVTNRFDSIMADLVEVQLEYGKAVEECMRGIAIREKQIAALPAKQAEVLRLRYIEDDHGRQLTWRQVALRMHYSEKSVRRIHGEALESMGEWVQDDQQCPLDL